MNQDPSFPPTPYPTRRPESTGVLSGALVVVFVLLAIWAVPWLFERIEQARARGRQRGEVEVIRAALPDMKLLDISKTLALPAKIISPSVVHIDTRSTSPRHANDEFSSLQPRNRELQGEASGVILDESGYIITNYHVVQGAQEIDVKLSDGRTFRGQRLGVDPAMDLALIKIGASNLTAATFADSDRLEVGEAVWAVGNPFGLDRTVTFGILSAKGRRGVNSPLQELLQTDAAVNPGNSGGPLVNIEGNVVGITTAIVGPTYLGVSFAIPSNSVREVYEHLKANKPVVRGYLGVALDKVSPEDLERAGLQDIHGALVRQVGPSSPAEKSGIQSGDLIVEWNSEKIDDPTELALLVARSAANSRVKIVLIRDGREMPLEVMVGERPAQLDE